MKTITDWTKQAADIHYRNSCVLLKMRIMSKTREPSEVFTILNYCSRCKNYIADRQSAEVICYAVGCSGRFNTLNCTFQEITAGDICVTA